MATNEAPAQEPNVLSPEQAEDEDLEAQLAYENFKRKREAKKRKRIIIIAAVVVVVLVFVIINVIGAANQSAEGEGTEELVTSMVREGDFTTTITANGATEPVNSTVVTPEVDGIIEDLQVQEGSHVEKDDVLFTLKNETLDKAITEAEAELRNAERAAVSASRTVDDAYAAYNKAVDAYNASGGEGEFDEAGLRSGIDSAEDGYQTALSTVETARTKVDEAKANADKRTVRAPVSGTIVSMSAQNGMAFGSVTGASGGTTSGSSSPLIQISDLSQMKVTVQVNEIDISSISVGQKATATFSALPDVELAATVERIASVSSGSGDAAGGAGAGGVVTYAVDLIIPEPDANLKPGMTATVSITTQSAPSSIIVPVAALNEAMDEAGNATYSVTVVDDPETQETHDVPVELVMKNTSEAAVKGELKDGDAVLIGSSASAEGEGDAAMMEGATV